MFCSILLLTLNQFFLKYFHDNNKSKLTDMYEIKSDTVYKLAFSANKDFSRPKINSTLSWKQAEGNTPQAWYFTQVHTKAALPVLYRFRCGRSS